ncbi:hypothetical protein [Pseudomonas frederiksbergensis]|uniref:hypothetical protein n=1 Tax=Pseudomonas frederiksbergensis TaxID=104087 RepID=UPI000F48CF06|nr:hypothetical protein [Pseudomonas frederiksbergensis]RON44109.1 hypothetical protein BK667_28190 [Pseudomonas frederiksbergensis]
MTNENVVPEIISITDAEGGPVYDGGATHSSTLNLSGTAGVNDVVDVILDGISIGSTQAKAGTWDYRLEDLSKRTTHTIQVSANGLPSLSWRVTVEAISPLILSVIDMAGRPVPDGGTTASTTLVLSGTAEVGSYVEVFVGDDRRGGTAVQDGTWSFIVTHLNMDRQHLFKAVADGLASNIWTVMVAVERGNVWIRTIKDSDGYDIPRSHYTASTKVDVIGSAAPGQLVRVFTTSGQENATVADPEGDWKVRLEGLIQQLYIVKVANSIENHDYRFRFVDQRLPIIRLARDSRGNPIPINGTTSDRSIVLTGTGAAGERLSVHNRLDLVGNPIVNILGVWELPVRDLPSDIHVFRVRGSQDFGLGTQTYYFRVS